MISFFPDLNVWLALSDQAHIHNTETWEWLKILPSDARLMFSRYTQVGLLRLLTNRTVMAGATLTIGEAWQMYEKWLADGRVEFYPEPRGLDLAFRNATEPLKGQPASKLIGDCYLLAFARESGAALVTFDQSLLAYARKHDYAAICPA